MPLLLLLVPVVQAQDHAVLMLGNSYTAYNDLPGLVESTLEPGVAAWDDVHTEGLMQGGLLLVDHLARADGSSGDTAWRDALVTGSDTWQHVVLQEQSQIPGFDATSADLQASWAAAADLDALIAAHGAETVFLMTWGRRDGDALNDHIYPDFTTMQDRLAAGYLTYVDQLSTPERPVWVIPAGLAWQTVHDDLVAQGLDPVDGETAFTQLYEPDGSHPSLQGSTLVAATALAALTGRSPVGLAGPDGVDTDALALLQDAAASTVFDDPHGVIDYPWAWTWAEWEAAAADPAAISQGALRPWLRVEVFGATVSDARLTDARLQLVEGSGLGALGSLEVADAEVWIDGGSLIVDTLTLGEGAVLELRGGTLGGTLIAGANTETLSMTGGQLIATTIDGDLDQLGGELLTGQAMTITGDWTLNPDGGFYQEGPAGWVAVEGTARLEGEFNVEAGSWGSSDEVIVVDAAHIAAEGLTVWSAPGWTLEERTGGRGEQLVLVPSDTGIEADTGSPDPPIGNEGCQCTSAPVPLVWLWLVVPWWHRRR